MISVATWLRKLHIHHPEIAVWMQASREPVAAPPPPRGLPAPQRVHTRGIYKADIPYPPLPDELIAVLDCTD